MLVKTHLVIGLFGILLLLPFVNGKIIFILVALIATLIPDVDSAYSTLGHKRFFGFLQFFVKHRGILHSFTFLILLTIVFLFFIPKIALGFFLGYALHLFADSFTKDGIVLFFPFKLKSSGKIKTGGKIETVIFVIFLMVDILMILVRLI
jgi:inner membrane protein